MATTITDMAALYQALGDETRLRILGLLRTGEVCVCDIHESLEIPQPKASRHLAHLRKAGLVDTRKDGLWVHYRLADLDDPVMTTLRDTALHAISHATAPRRDVDRLQRRTGCCRPSLESRPDLACCAD
jgi:ArsR family transcriptional regulator, arsenate/arsenite/antimonite-responsive transcriptional repressor